MIYECRITVYNFVKFVNEGADGDEEAKGVDGSSLPATPSVTGLGGVRRLTGAEGADGTDVAAIYIFILLCG